MELTRLSGLRVRAPWSQGELAWVRSHEPEDPFLAVSGLEQGLALLGSYSKEEVPVKLGAGSARSRSRVAAPYFS